MATRERIKELADPVAFLANVMGGNPMEAAAMKDAPETVKVFPTLDQRLAAARWLGDRLLPPAKGRIVPLDLPPINGAADLEAAFSVVVQRVSDGTISAEEGVAFSAVLDAKRKSIETSELERRIAAIEGLGHAKS